ncbi:hypothetical protein ADUPG1_006784, partial [Aduncisulcus paluster]
MKLSVECKTFSGKKALIDYNISLLTSQLTSRFSSSKSSKLPIDMNLSLCFLFKSLIDALSKPKTEPTEDSSQFQVWDKCFGLLFKNSQGNSAALSHLCHAISCLNAHTLQLMSESSIRNICDFCLGYASLDAIVELEHEEASQSSSKSTSPIDISSSSPLMASPVLVRSSLHALSSLVNFPPLSDNPCFLADVLEVCMHGIVDPKCNRMIRTESLACIAVVLWKFAGISSSRTSTHDHVKIDDASTKTEVEKDDFISYIPIPVLMDLTPVIKSLICEQGLGMRNLVSIIRIIGLTIYIICRLYDLKLVDDEVFKELSTEVEDAEERKIKAVNKSFVMSQTSKDTPQAEFYQSCFEFLSNVLCDRMFISNIKGKWNAAISLSHIIPFISHPYIAISDISRISMIKSLIRDVIHGIKDPSNVNIKFKKNCLIIINTLITEGFMEVSQYYDSIEIELMISAELSVLGDGFSEECSMYLSDDDHLVCNEVYPGRYAAECEDGYFYDET